MGISKRNPRKKITDDDRALHQEKLVETEVEKDDGKFMERLKTFIPVRGEELGLSFWKDGGIRISDRKKLFDIIESDNNPDVDLFSKTLSGFYTRLRNNGFARDRVSSKMGVVVYLNSSFLNDPVPSPSPSPPPLSISSSSSSPSCTSKPPPPPPSSSSSSCSFPSPLQPFSYKQLVQVMDDMEKEENLRIQVSPTEEETKRAENFKRNILKLRELARGFHIQFLQLKETSLVEQDKQYTLVFVIGGPGSGKTTLCQSLAQKYGFLHIDASDARDDPLAKDGTMVIPYIQNVIHRSENKRFIIDGFPLIEGEQSAFNSIIGFEPILFLYLNASLNTMKERLGEHDTTLVEKRLEEYFEVGLSFIGKLQHEGWLTEVDGNGTREEVFTAVKQHCDLLR